MRTAMPEFAFVQCHMAEFESRTGEVAVQRKKGRDRPRSAIQPRQRDMRGKDARLGRDADAREQLVDLAVQRRERLIRLDPGPYHVRPALAFEQANPRDPRRHRRRVKCAERRGDILGHMVIDLADEAQGQVELLVILPARPRDAVHRGEQYIAERARRAQRDEQAVRGHGGSIAAMKGIAIPNLRWDNNIAGILLVSGFA